MDVLSMLPPTATPTIKEEEDGGQEKETDISAESELVTKTNFFLSNHVHVPSKKGLASWKCLLMNNSLANIFLTIIVSYSY